MKRRVFVLCLLIALLCMLSARLGADFVYSFDGFPVHNLTTGLSYATIQEAVNANETLNGQTILVDSGVYNEQVVVSKAISLVGENANTTILDGTGLTAILEVQSDNVTVTGFTVRNCGLSSGGRAFSLNSVRGANLSGNNVYNSYYAVWMFSSSSVSLIRNDIEGNNVGVLFISSSGNRVLENNVESNLLGFELVSSSNNTLSGNRIAHNSHGIALYPVSNSNIIYRNDIADNGFGIEVDNSTNNSIYHNNFFNNTNQFFLYASSSSCQNVWDNGYPSGGNFWSDYTAKYPNAAEVDASGVWNTQYVINANNTDKYPLMARFVIPELSWLLALPFFTSTILLVFMARKSRKTKAIIRRKV